MNEVLLLKPLPLPMHYQFVIIKVARGSFRLCIHQHASSSTIRDSVSVIITSISSFLGDTDNESKCLLQFWEMGQLLHPHQLAIGHGANELFVGRAGYLCMALWITRMLGRNVIPLTFMELLFKAIVEEGRSYSRKHRSQSPLMYSYYDTECLGTAPEDFANIREDLYLLSIECMHSLIIYFILCVCCP